MNLLIFLPRESQVIRGGVDGGGASVSAPSSCFSSPSPPSPDDGCGFTASSVTTGFVLRIIRKQHLKGQLILGIIFTFHCGYCLIH